MCRSREPPSLQQEGRPASLPTPTAAAAQGSLNMPAGAGRAAAAGAGPTAAACPGGPCVGVRRRAQAALLALLMLAGLALAAAVSLHPHDFSDALGSYCCTSTRLTRCPLPWRRRRGLLRQRQQRQPASSSAG